MTKYYFLVMQTNLGKSWKQQFYSNKEGKLPLLLIFSVFTGEKEKGGVM